MLVPHPTTKVLHLTGNVRVLWR